MVDVNGDGKADYCRAVGTTSGAGSYLACNFSTGSGFTYGFDIMSPIDDWGYADRRFMVDVNGDGKADFCRAVGEGWGGHSTLRCTLSDGHQFSTASEKAYFMPDWGASDRRFFADVDGDHHADFGHTDSANDPHFVFELL
jgi:hypothetical protein